jgi:histidyl-tRNA synthetase
MQRVRGTQDIFPSENLSFRKVEATARELSKIYGFGEIQTPILEFTEVFLRTLGETSDVVQKETYSFLDRGSESLTLRPEGTAGIARAFISEGLSQNLPLKFFYSGPMFRHERPQKGRYRQFHQIGVEYLGPSTPQADVEILSLAWQLLSTLDLAPELCLEINTLGDTESRNRYKESLVEYYLKYEKDLSPDSQMRLKKNPLRILDSKNEGDKIINSTAPEYDKHLNDLSKSFFGSVLEGLALQNIPVKINPKLVRGLDYYCHTVFEFLTDKLGSQGTVLAGGRYDGLIELMGGPPTPGVGWAAGIERLAELTSTPQQNTTFIYIIPADEIGEKYSSFIASLARRKKISAEVLFSGNFGKKMKKASQAQVPFVGILGSTEIANKTVTVKKMKDGSQQNVSWEDFPSYVFDLFKKEGL